MIILSTRCDQLWLKISRLENVSFVKKRNTSGKMSREIIMYIAISQLKPKCIYYVLLDFIFKVLSRNMRIKSQIMSYRLINPQQRGHKLYTFSNLLYICAFYGCTSVKTKHNLGKIILFQPLILDKTWFIVTKKKLNIKI